MPTTKMRWKAARPRLALPSANASSRAEISRLRTLPRHEQEIVELCFWTGLDTQSAAVALDVPLGTVKSRLARARKHLRELSIAVPDDVVRPESLEDLS